MMAAGVNLKMMKALTRFSWGAYVFDVGEEITDVIPEDKQQKLAARGLIGEGEGSKKKDPEGIINITEKVQKAETGAKEKKHIAKPGTEPAKKHK